MDNIILYNILVGSVRKNLNQAKLTGNLDFYDLHILDLFGKLLNDFKDNLTLYQSNCLEEAIRTLQNNNTNICYYKNNYSNIYNSNVNNPPTINNHSVVVPELIYTFASNELTSSFNDIDGDLPDEIQIIELPQYGNILYHGNIVSLGRTLFVFDQDEIQYEWTDYDNVTDTFKYKVSDNNENNPLYSNMATMTLNITVSINLPPSQVGSLSLNIDNSTIYTFTSANFTTETTPIYLDPEGDAASNIKITSLPIEGVLSLDNVPINLNNIISFDNINLSKLKYISNFSNQSSYIDTFNFSISDQGSERFTPGGVITFNVAEYINQAPTVGDSELTVDEGNLITFTRNNFLIDADPDYADADGDLAVAIRFPTLPATGLIKLNSVNVTVNQEIDLVDLDNSLLTYTQSSNAGGTTPSFTFNIKDSFGNWSN